MAHKKNVELKKSFERMNYLYSGMNKTSDFRNKNLINFVIKYLRKGSVLDIGCGDGTFLNQISKMEYVSYGIEPNKQMFDIINKNKNKNVNIYNLFAEDIEKIDIKFDNIVMLDVLEHIRDDFLQINKVFNKLNPQGRFIVVVPAHKFLYGKRDKSMGHYRRYSAKEIKSILIQQGFKIKKERYWNALGVPFYLISEKIFKKELDTNLRNKSKKNVVQKIFSFILDNWFKYIENKINFGFGLSIIIVAEK